MHTLKFINPSSALHKISRRGLPYSYDLNIYRGCSHGCKYCYAFRSAKYCEGFDPEKEVIAKKGIAEILDRELSSKSWRGDIINIGGICDSYQSCESECELMPGILRVLIKHRNPVIISTKSDLILRDISLIDSLASRAWVNIPVCITSCNETVSRNTEPGASLPEDRFRALCELSKTRANTALHVMPVLPFLSDNPETLENLVSWASKARVSYMMTGILYLTGGIRNRYLRFIDTLYPELSETYRVLYSKGSAAPDYKKRVHSIIGRLRAKYGVSNRYSLIMPKITPPELPLFPGL